MGGDETVERGARTLEAVLLSEPPTIGDAIRMASEVADEVAALHAAGRAHGGIAPATVDVDQDGVAWLAGPPAPKTGPAAPPALRAEDLHGVGRVLAAALGWPDREELPVPVAGLVQRAEASDAPAAALAAAVRRLDREPVAVAALLPGTAAPVPARQQDRSSGGVLGMIPRADRRTTGTAAIAVAGAAAVGALLLLVGSPASTGRAPTAAAEARSARAVAAPPVAADVADAPPRSVQAVLRPKQTPTRPVPAGTSQPVVRAAVPAVELATPTPAPTALPSAAPTSSATVPAAPTATPTAEPSGTPSAEPSGTPSAPASGEPSAPPSSSEPTQPPSAPAPPSEAPTASTPAAPTPAADPAPAG